MSERTPLRVVYADDDESIRNLISTFLLDQGIDIYTASSGQAAIELVQSVHPDVVILDLVMPEVDGFEAARRISSRHRHTRPRLIALTGAQGPDTLEAARRAGFDEFLKKPATGRAVLQALGQSGPDRPDDTCGNDAHQAY
jgi:CheY-like chemotaxis protein